MQLICGGGGARLVGLGATEDNDEVIVTSNRCGRIGNWENSDTVKLGEHIGGATNFITVHIDSVFGIGGNVFWGIVGGDVGVAIFDKFGTFGASDAGLISGI